MKKFEQLIEYVINDEEDKARELFHEIVVEKSKDIYEEIMAEEEIEESEEEVTEADDAEEDEEAIEESELGGSQVDDLIDEIEADEQGVAEADDEEIEMIDMDDEGDEGDAEDLEDLEDRVVNVEDKLDELMAEFEELMAQVDDNEEDIEAAHGDEEVEMDMDMDMDADEEPMEGLEEGVALTAAPKPVTTSEKSNSPVAANSGAKGMDAKPVSTSAGDEKGRPAPKAQDMGGTTAPDEKPAPKADNSQAASVNTKSPVGSK
jgi:hypothetical protein